MTRNTTRVGRRRRVLNEEVLSASNLTARSGTNSATIEPGDTPRYGVGANIENHPQVTSFVPRRLRTLVLLGLLGIGAAVFAELTAHYAPALSELVPVVSPAEITEVFANRLVAWVAAVILLATATYTRLIYSLRRHRVDDYRGRYRVWRTAGWAATFLSLSAVLSGHELVARALGHLIDYQILPSGALWWLVPAALFGGWLLTKLIVEISECRSAMVVYLLAAACLTVAAIHSAGWSPAWTEAWPGVLSRALPLVSYTLLLLGSQRFARYVVLDVQGLIEHPASRQSRPSQVDSAEPEIAVTPVREAASPPQASAWIDGSEPAAESQAEFEETSKERRSKSARKRLRKQNQRRAA